MDVFRLEFRNLDFCGLQCCHASTMSDRLSNQSPTSVWGTDISLQAIDMRSEEGEKPLPTMSVAQLPPVPSLFWLPEVFQPTYTVVKVPNKCPSHPNGCKWVLCINQRRVVSYYHPLPFLNSAGCYTGSRSGCLTQHLM